MLHHTPKLDILVAIANKIPGKSRKIADSNSKKKLSFFTFWH